MQALKISCQADWAAVPLAQSRPARPFNPALHRRWCTKWVNTSRNVKTRFVPTPGPDTVAPIEGEAILVEAVEESPAFAAKDWSAAFISQRQEFEYEVNEVEGTIPAFLRGTLFRNGPGNFERGEERYKHMLDGDGYVSSFSFGEGNRVHFRSRYVRTREFTAEEARDAIMHRNTFGTQRPGGAIANAFDLQLKNPANTNVIEWGGRLLSLWEAGPPYELDPHSLRTTGSGPALLGGLLIDGVAPSSTNSYIMDKVLRLGNAMTAHPHVVPETEGSPKRMVTWVWRSLLKPFFNADMQIDVVEYGPGWERLGGTSFTMSHCFFNPHDFAITPNHHVFFQNALAFDMGPYLLGHKGPAQCIHFTEQPMKVHLVSRTGGPSQEFEAEPTFLIHHANAFEAPDGSGDVLVWSSGWGPATLARVKARQEASHERLGMLGDWNKVEEGDFSRIPFTALWCHRISLASGRVTRTPLYEAGNMDHPKVNPNFYSRPTRFVWFNGAAQPLAEAGASGPPQAFLRLDTQTGDVQKWAPGPRCFCEELVFVPRGPDQDAAQEDDGVLLGMVFDAETHRSSLVILDAADVGKGPIARVPLRHHVPHGLHGYYSDTYFGPAAAADAEAPVWAAMPQAQLRNNAQVLPKKFWRFPGLGRHGANTGKAEEALHR